MARTGLAGPEQAFAGTVGDRTVSQERRTARALRYGCPGIGGAAAPLRASPEERESGFAVLASAQRRRLGCAEADRITQTGSGHAHIASLRREDAHGGLFDDIFSALQKDQTTALHIAYSLVEAHFPESLHNDVLRAVGIDSGFPTSTGMDFVFMEDRAAGLEFEHVRRRSRDPAFARAVLDAYGDRCAVCEFAVRLRDAPVALDAAHIRWHRAGGRDRDKIGNGLALCTLHHRLFDAGAFTLSPKYTVIVSPAAAGPGADSTLDQFSRCPILLPRRTEDYPDFKSLKWHHREVFGPVVEGIDY